MSAFTKGISARMQSAGGQYNFGNVLDLYSVAASALVARAPANFSDALHALQETFTGDAPSIFLSAAALVFFAGGEAYYQAWKKGYPPNRWANFSGDSLSGIGAILLGIGLYGIGQPILAAGSGGLHALSKFGSALGVSKKLEPMLNKEFRLAGYVTTTMDVIKDMALVSRIPALMSCAESVIENFTTQPWHQAVAKSVMPALLGWCYMVWGRADWMLTQRNSLLKQTALSLGKLWDKVTTSTFMPKHSHEDISSQQNTARAGIRYVSALATVSSLTLVSSLIGPELRGVLLPLALPLLAKMTWSFAKAGASANAAHAEMKRPQYKEQPQKPLSLNP